MRKVSILTLSLVMLINSSVVFSAPRKRRNSGGITPAKTTTSTTISSSNVSEVQVLQTEVNDIASSENKEEVQNIILSTLQSNIEQAKNSCSGIKDDLKAIQVLAGVSTGVSGLGTLTSGGALVTGIMKAKTDKNIEELQAEIDKIKLVEERANNLSDKPEELLNQLRTIMPELEADVSALEKEVAEETKKSKTLGNVRTGLMAGSIATSATSTITSGINIKKLDDLIAKMKSCNNAITSLDANIKNAEAENIDTDLTSYKNITESCSGFDTNNIKEIKGVMTASTVVGGVGTAVSTAGTITSALANSQQVRSAVGEEGAKKEKGLNLASNIMAGVSTATSGAGIVLGAVTLKKLQDNVDTAEKCEDALK